MQTVFLDANILFAATASATGASRAILELARFRKLRAVSSMYAVNEAKVNIEKKLDKKELIAFYILLSALNEISSKPLQKKHLSTYESLIVGKDLPILIAAHMQKADFLITLDRKDFFTEKLHYAKLPYKILLPGEFLISFV